MMESPRNQRYVQFQRLVAACRVDADDALLGEVEDLPGFIDLASRHRVLSQLIKALEGSRALLSPEQSAQVRLRALSQASRTLSLIADTREAVDALRSCGLDTLVLKGPALSILAYGVPTGRVFVDCDLLVHRAQLAAAIAKLHDLGYVDDRRVSRVNQDIRRSVNNELTLRRSPSDLQMDLHWRLSGITLPRNIPDDTWWDAPLTLQLSGGTIKTLSVENTLMLLAIEAIRHGWSRLDWACCTDRIARHDVDWPQLLSRASQNRVLRRLLLSLAVSRNLLGTPLPPEVKAMISGDLRLPGVVAAVVDGLADPAVPDGGTRHWNLILSVADSTQDAVRVIFRPTKADLMLRLPRQLDLVHYGLRPIRLAVRLARMRIAPRRTSPGTEAGGDSLGAGPKPLP